ncbi:hypothetical protein QR680_012667 [Steinernema hermaphroditum]|uniref:Uncharacterized protein n=1 Tax=Steinernema hermaphroditum TaxID=289476 RepID=A0AA39I435_9BILA|nr:hypothetical protein QR680_012667 [Steinernema hermaphroditum]
MMECGRGCCQPPSPHEARIDGDSRVAALKSPPKRPPAPEATARRGDSNPRPSSRPPRAPPVAPPPTSGADDLLREAPLATLPKKLPGEHLAETTSPSTSDHGNPSEKGSFPCLKVLPPSWKGSPLKARAVPFVTQITAISRLPSVPRRRSDSYSDSWRPFPLRTAPLTTDGNLRSMPTFPCFGVPGRGHQSLLTSAALHLYSTPRARGPLRRRLLLREHRPPRASRSHGAVAARWMAVASAPGGEAPGLAMRLHL